MSSRRRNTIAAAVFNEIWQAKSRGETIHGFTAARRARNAMRERGLRAGVVDDEGLVILLERGDLTVIVGSSDALLDAEVTIDDVSYRRRLDARAARPRMVN